MINYVKIDEISQIRFGLYSQTESKGPIAFLQVRQFDKHGRKIHADDEFLNRSPKTEAHLLQEGDVLFAGKGNRLFAWRYKKKYGPAIASSIFFIISPHTQLVYPEYLTAILNAPQSKAAFQQIGSGTNILSIRKAELGAFEIPLLPIEKQKKIAAVSTLHQQEIALSEELIVQKQNLYLSIISKLINYGASGKGSTT